PPPVIFPLSLHDALPISPPVVLQVRPKLIRQPWVVRPVGLDHHRIGRWHLAPQQRVHGVRRLVRIPTKPHLRPGLAERGPEHFKDRKSTRLNSSHVKISY